MNSMIEGIILKIANRLGLELQKKKDLKIKYSEKGINPTAIGANVVTNIAVDDSDIQVVGDSARAQAIQELLYYYVDNILSVAAEVSLGTGDCLIRPFTDGNDIGFNIIGSDDFLITASIGYRLKGVIIKLDEYETRTSVYRLFESQSLRTEGDKQVVVINRFAFKGSEETDISKTIWKDITTEEYIVADQLLLGRYKCPTINRDNYNSANGVPITFGCAEIIDNIKKKYEQYNDEFDRKESKIFADRTLFRRDKNDKLELSSAKEFVSVRGGVDGGITSQIYDYSPSIREEEFKSANDFNLSILELCCGFSRGIFTSPETSFATATELKNSLKKTFAFVKSFRRRIEHGNKELFNAVNIIMNLNSVTPDGKWELQHDWSYDYIEQTSEKFNQLIQSLDRNAIKTEDLTAWVLNLRPEEAAEYVEDIEAKQNEEVQKQLKAAMNE